MARQVIRFYARSAQGVLRFLRESIPEQEIVRRSGRGYRDWRTKPETGGWYMTVVLETEAVATKFRQWIAQQPDVSLEKRDWPDFDFSGASSLRITLDLQDPEARPRFSFTPPEATKPPRFNPLRWLRNHLGLRR
jgi:hypothetical protein